MQAEHASEVLSIGNKLEGADVDHINRKLVDLKKIFNNEAAWQQLDPEQVVYEVSSYFPVAENTAGGLFYGITRIKPGLVGSEYFMTKGHFHAVRDRGEIYTTIAGEGALILMDEQRNTWVEYMRPGSVHYIPGRVAHRTANTGTTELSFWAVWPSDAGHDYESIKEKGFSKILIKTENGPALVDSK